VNDKLPGAGMKALAEQCGVSVLGTPMPMYEACAALYRLCPPEEAREARS